MQLGLKLLYVFLEFRPPAVQGTAPVGIERFVQVTPIKEIGDIERFRPGAPFQLEEVEQSEEHLVRSGVKRCWPAAPLARNAEMVGSCLASQ